MSRMVLKAQSVHCISSRSWRSSDTDGKRWVHSRGMAIFSVRCRNTQLGILHSDPGVQSEGDVGQDREQFFSGPARIRKKALLD